MSADEGFLARWSRRKRDAARHRRAPAKPAAAEAGAAAQAPAAETPPLPDRPPGDAASLPPLASIGAESDITGFLAPDVPPDLARAALRRAWSADPAIRDFIGLSENSWDFTAPGGVPGFAALDADEVRRLLAQAIGEPPAAAAPAAERAPDDRTPAADQPVDQEADAAPDRDPGPEPPALPAEADDAAPQHETAERTTPPRRHGGALPD